MNTNKRNKSIILLVSCVVSVTLFSGCQPIEDKLTQNVPKTSTIQPMTAIEYTSKINRALLPIISSSETIQAHHLEIVKGKYSSKEEIKLIDRELKELQKTIGELENLYVTKQYIDHKNSTIEHLNNYREILQKYKTTLESEKQDNDNIKKQMLAIKDAIGTLKTDFSLYQQ